MANSFQADVASGTITTASGTDSRGARGRTDGPVAGRKARPWARRSWSWGGAIGQEPVGGAPGGRAGPGDVASATTGDGARVEAHRSRRPDGRTTLEVPRDLDEVLPGLVEREGSVIIDCVTFWITNLMLGLGGLAALSAREDAAILAVVGRVAVSARGEGGSSG